MPNFYGINIIHIKGYNPLIYRNPLSDNNLSNQIRYNYPLGYDLNMNPLL